MKKIILNLKGSQLDREQMKKIRGGALDTEVGSYCIKSCPGGGEVEIKSEDQCKKCTTYDYGARCSDPDIDRKCPTA